MMALISSMYGLKDYLNFRSHSSCSLCSYLSSLLFSMRWPLIAIACTFSWRVGNSFIFFSTCSSISTYIEQYVPLLLRSRSHLSRAREKDLPISCPLAPSTITDLIMLISKLNIPSTNLYTLFKVENQFSYSIIFFDVNQGENGNRASQSSLSSIFRRLFPSNFIDYPFQSF